MIEFIKSNYQILGICAMVLIVLIVRIISLVRREKQAQAQEKREQSWETVISRCRDAGDYSLTDREAARFSAGPMLRAFGELTENEEKEACSEILRANSKKLVARVEGHADNAEKGYFAYILSIADMSGLGEDERADYTALVRKLLSNDSVYCRENALKALYNLGDAEAVAAAVETLSADARYHNEKLLSDGMNSFRGDRKALAEALMKHFDKYDDHSQSAVITFFTVAGFHDWDECFKERLESADISVDQRCDLLRLIMKAPSEETKQILIKTLQEKGSAPDWQTAAVAATGLASYPDDEETVQALKRGITSPEWNVRINSAFALVSLDPPQEVLDGILNGGDAYARDALKFAQTSKSTVTGR